MKAEVTPNKMKEVNLVFVIENFAFYIIYELVIQGNQIEVNRNQYRRLRVAKRACMLSSSKCCMNPQTKVVNNSVVFIT